MLVYTTGTGVNGFTLDPAVGEFFLSHPSMEFPATGATYSINDAVKAKSGAATQSFIDGCREAVDAGFRGRYIGSLVADFHRNLIHGGIYLYPSTTDKPEGKLRVLYEACWLGSRSKQVEGPWTTTAESWTKCQRPCTSEALITSGTGTLWTPFSPVA